MYGQVEEYAKGGRHMYVKGTLSGIKSSWYQKKERWYLEGRRTSDWKVYKVKRKVWVLKKMGIWDERVSAKVKERNNVLEEGEHMVKW